MSSGALGKADRERLEREMVALRVGRLSGGTGSSSLDIDVEMA